VGKDTDGTGKVMLAGSAGSVGRVIPGGTVGKAGMVAVAEGDNEGDKEGVVVARLVAGDGGKGLAQMFPCPFSVVTEYEAPLLRMRTVPSWSVR
jgi:hypothetical protein